MWSSNSYKWWYFYIKNSICYNSKVFFKIFLNSISSKNLKIADWIKRSKSHSHSSPDLIIRDDNREKITKVAIRPTTMDNQLI